MTDQSNLKITGRSVSRRAFIKRLGAGLFAAAFVAFDGHSALAQAAPAVAMGTGQGVMVGESPAAAATALWSKATFAARVGQSFTVFPGGAAMTLKLVNVADGTARIYHNPQSIQPASPDACFELVFSGSHTRLLKDKTYLFQHPALGKFSLYIGRGAASNDSQHYTAVVNCVHA